MQLARKPEPAAEAGQDKAEAGEGQQRRRGSTRGRGRGRGRGGRAARGGRNGRKDANGEEITNGGPTNVPGQAAPLASTTNEALTGEAGEAGTIDVDGKKGAPRKQRGPPEDGVPSKTKIMVANLPYDLREEKVRST